MKYLRLFGLLLFTVVVMFQSSAYSQCGGGGTNSGTVVMLPTFQTMPVNTGERYTFEAYSFTTYVVSFCQGGGSNAVDTQLEICDELGNTVYEYDDDHCGLGSEITWTCNTTGTYSFVIHEYYCTDDGAAAGTLAYKTQTPPTEQDCLGAIPLCFDNYSTTNSYAGEGHYMNEIPEYGGSMADDNCPGNCLLGGEINDVWYTFTVQTSGTVSFTISPNDPADDYDWAVYDITNDNCSNIPSSAASLQVSCNFCGTSGDTGPTGGSAESCQHGNSCTNFNDALSVNAGETYVVNVSNWSATQSGYSITFGGTAQIVDNSDPELVDLVYQPSCGASNLTFQMSERIWCIGTGPEDFVLTGPQGEYEIADVWSNVCQAGLGSSYGDTYYDDIWTLELNDYLQHSGDYTLELVSGGVDDVCGNGSSAGTITFHIDGVEATASVLNGVTCYSDTDGSAQVDSVGGGTPPYTYLWSSGETGDLATSLSGGINYVTVTDSTGLCSDIVAVNIPAPPPIVVDAGDDRIICPGDFTVLGGTPTASNGTSPYMYTWEPAALLDNPVASNPTATPPVDQAFSVLVEDADGCLGTDTVLVEVAPPLVLSANSVDASCYGQADGEAEIIVSGGIPPYSYNWSHSLGDSSYVDGLQAGLTYSVTVQDSVGCTATASLGVGQPPEMNITPDPTDCECGTSTGVAAVNVSGGTTPYTYVWSTGDSTASVNGLTPGDYTVTLIDANSCTATEVVSIGTYGNNPVTITQSGEIFCHGETGVTLQADMPDGYMPMDFSWSGCSATGPTTSSLEAGVYSVTVTDTFGCEGMATDTITEPPILAMDLLVEDVECSGGGNTGEAEVAPHGGTPPYSVQWSSGDTGSIVSGLGEGNHSVSLTDAKGCTVSDNFNIDAPDEPVKVYVSTSHVSCPGGSDGTASATAFGGTPPYHFIWYEGGGAIANGDSLSGLPASDYQIEALDENDCSDKTPFAIHQPDPFLIDKAYETVSCRGFHDGEAAVSVSGGTAPYDYMWSTGDSLPAIQQLETGNYKLTITDYNDCKKITTIFVPENSQLCLRIPNAFTPNGDGVNDTWEIEYINEYPRAHVMVFNRWGQKLYDATAGDEPWDGMVNGNLVPSGSYSYIVDLNNEIEPFSGVVSIVH